MLGVPRSDSADPDWFYDPVTGRHAPDQRLAFRINHRDEAETGNIKQIWELSRHHHLTVLATAWWLSQDERYADAAADQLRSWWAANPFLSGVHWTSGIEASPVPYTTTTGTPTRPMPGTTGKRSPGTK